MQSTGGVLIRNVTISGCVSGGIRNFTAPATGQANTINNCLIAYSGVALQAPSVGILLEDYNNLFGNVTARTNVTAGAHSQAYQPGFAVPLLTLGIHQPTFDALESASPLSSIAGFNPPYDDFYGTVRAATSSWGAVQYEATRRPNDAGYSAGRRMGAT
jgi:hypothetical protein